MHHQQLRPHPAAPGTAVQQLTVDIDWHDVLVLHYRLSGNITALSIPAPAAALRTDELWRHTCCELFVTTSQADWYCEFNFSPSSAWAAYRFDGYRSGMQPLELLTPAITIEASAAQLLVTVRLALGSIPALQAARELRCALAAVTEEHAGARSFWALAHPSAQPDFHHPGSFALQLTAVADASPRR
jgi:hypothetical protein